MLIQERFVYAQVNKQDPPLVESSPTDWQKPSCGIAVLISLAWYVCLTCSLFTSLINLTCRHFFNLKSSYGSPFLCKLGLLCGPINTFTTPECMRGEKWNKDMSNWAVLSWEVMHPKEKSTQESVINVTHPPVSSLHISLLKTFYQLPCVMAVSLAHTLLT